MKKYKVGIIGIGRIAYAHIEALNALEHIEITAISSRSNIEQKAKQLNIENYYSDYKEMLDNEDLDSVHICTSNDVHFEIASYALDKGLHIVLEKPMTMDVSEAIKLYEKSRANNLVCKIQFHNRFYGVNQYIRNHIAEIGDVVSIHGGYTQGWAANPNVFDWRDQRKYGGETKVISDIGTHYFDLVEFLTGHKITEVSAQFKQTYPTRDGHVVDTEDVGVVIYKTNKGAIGTAILSQSIIGDTNEVDITISGKIGTFKTNPSDGTTMQQARLDSTYKMVNQRQVDTLKDNVLYDATNHIEVFRESFRQFYYKLSHKAFIYDFADFADGLHSMRLVDAIYRSNLKQAWITLHKE